MYIYIYIYIYIGLRVNPINSGPSLRRLLDPCPAAEAEAHSYIYIYTMYRCVYIHTYTCILAGPHLGPSLRRPLDPSIIHIHLYIHAYIYTELCKRADPSFTRVYLWSWIYLLEQQTRAGSLADPHLGPSLRRLLDPSIIHIHLYTHLYIFKHIYVSEQTLVSLGLTLDPEFTY